MVAMVLYKEKVMTHTWWNLTNRCVRVHLELVCYLLGTLRAYYSMEFETDKCGTVEGVTLIVRSKEGSNVYKLCEEYGFTRISRRKPNKK